MKLRKPWVLRLGGLALIAAADALPPAAPEMLAPETTVHPADVPSADGWLGFYRLDNHRFALRPVTVEAQAVDGDLYFGEGSGQSLFKIVAKGAIKPAYVLRNVPGLSPHGFTGRGLTEHEDGRHSTLPLPPNLAIVETCVSREDGPPTCRVGVADRTPVADDVASRRPEAYAAIWVGDADGDGRDDYLIEHHGELSYTVLCLSSAAGADRQAQEVSRWRHPDYC